MKKFIYCLIWIVFIFTICSIKCKTIDPLIWGWRTGIFFMVYSGTGVLVLLAKEKGLFRDLGKLTVIWIVSYVVMTTIILFTYSLFFKGG